MSETEFVLSKGLISLLFLSCSAACASSTPPTSPRDVVEAWIPAYPEFMILTGEEVELTVEASVARSGEVKKARALPPEGKDEDLMAYWKDHETFARRWKFRASPQERRVEIRFIYQLLPHDADLYESGTSFVAPATVIIRAREFAPIVWDDPGLDLRRGFPKK